MYIRFTFSCFLFLIRGNLKSFRTEGLQIVFVLVVVVAVVVVWGFFYEKWLSLLESRPTMLGKIFRTKRRKQMKFDRTRTFLISVFT